MAKLTHIEDVERRKAEEEDEREMLEAQEALQRAQEREAGRKPEQLQRPAAQVTMRVAAKPAATSPAAETEDAAQVEQAEETLETLEEAAEGEPVLDVTADAEKEATERNAEEEMEFHGLSSDDSMGGMQKALIIIAAVIFIAAILYVVNTWVHFV